MDPKPSKPAEVVIETKEHSIKVKVPVKPNVHPASGAEFPALVVLVYADGTRVTYPVREPKASTASGKVNAWAGGKLSLEDGTQCQLGINMTVLD